MSSLLVPVAVPVPLRQSFSYAIPDEMHSPAITVGERVLISFGHRRLIGIVLAEPYLEPQPPANIKPLLARFDDSNHLSESLMSLLQQCARYYHHPVGEVCWQALPALLRKVEQQVYEAPTAWFATPQSDVVLPKSAVKQQALYQLLCQHNGKSWPELRTLGFSKTQLHALQNKGLIGEQQVKAQPYRWQQSDVNDSDKPKLSTEQALVTSAISGNTDAFACHLIEGITGSGKTEVYLQTMEAVLKTGRQVLLLVPEIGLTPQTLNRIEQRFNVPIYLHHSGMNDTERLHTWIAAGQAVAAIVIGTRSAVFSPVQNLGLIIVDEEHDLSLKQQDGFRYHARDVAILRARQLNIPVVLGSATPSFETLHNALSGKYHHHQLLHRPGNSSMAKIALLDMNTQPVTCGMSLALKQTIKQTLARGEQVLVFLNRRGYAPAVSCGECHDIITCQRCNKPYTLHKEQRLLICHHCGSQKRVPKQCVQCGSVRLAPLGQGTEQLEQHLQSLFAEYSTVRIDRDSTRRKGELTKILQQVADKQHQLLIGTQMLAKGHHFPDVTLVAVLDVDGALYSYDFRAAEHLGQLLVQVAGRAGRASKPGTVLVQSYYPQHPLLQDLVHNGYGHFARQELAERQLAKLPPFSYQALFRAEANYPQYPNNFLRALAELPFSDCVLAGPIPAAMEKKAGKYGYHLIVQAGSRAALHGAVNQAIQASAENEWSGKVRWSVDIDPLDLTW